MSTPDNIAELGINEVIIFGSNLEGNHVGGLARVCRERWGAMNGKGVGIQGQCYALPTMGGIPQLIMYSVDLYYYIISHPELTFYLTKVGCGIAGYKEEEIIPIFSSWDMDNLIKPEGW